LNQMVPNVTGGKPKILSMHPYNAITLRMPGRHAKDTDPVGGDFVVCVDDENMDWIEHQFTHTDLFMDLQDKRDFCVGNEDSALAAEDLMNDYYKVIYEGTSPDLKAEVRTDWPGLHAQTFLYAVQCLAVAEHRRYARFEPKFGGRYLPFRFGAGIVEGLWTATDAAEKQKRGRPGVEWLEKDFGVPTLTKELMG
jgi:hypothetical protein